MVTDPGIMRRTMRSAQSGLVLSIVLALGAAACATTANGPAPPATASAAPCKATGCSGQVCADQDRVTTCEWRAQYACYRSAKCERQPDGTCGWTQTEELSQCLQNPPQQ
jgi:eight-cysteine-cluster-containing protein